MGANNKTESDVK